jgi:hypothetical protein
MGSVYEAAVLKMQAALIKPVKPVKPAKQAQLGRATPPRLRFGNHLVTPNCTIQDTKGVLSRL